MADVTDQNSWKDAINATPPTNWTNTSNPAVYEFSINSGGWIPYAPLIFLGNSGNVAPYLNGTFYVDWAYSLGAQSDLGMAVLVSFDGGATWNATNVVASGTGQSHSGTLSFTIPGNATGIQVGVGEAGWIG